MQLVSMKDSKISHSVRKIFIGLLNETEHDTVAWAVHGFKSKLLSFILDPINVVFVFEVMSADLPKFRRVDVGTDDFIVSSNFVFSLHHVHQSRVDDGSMGIE